MGELGKMIDVCHQQSELIRLLNGIGNKQQDQIAELKRREKPQWMEDVARAVDGADCQEALYLLATGKEQITHEEFESIRNREDYGAAITWLLDLVREAVDYQFDEETEVATYTVKYNSDERREIAELKTRLERISAIAEHRPSRNWSKVYHIATGAGS